MFRNIQQEQTYNEIVSLLLKHGKCAVERPVGFGKTWIFAKISALYKKVLFITPTKVIRDDIEVKYAGIRCSDSHFSTYAMTGRLGKWDNLDSLLGGGYDLIVFDELHCAGAEQARSAIKTMMPQFEDMGVHLLGGTATNDRSDSYDPIIDMFDNIQPSIYTMDDMLKDKLAPKPHYTYTTFGKVNSIQRYFQGMLRDLPVHMSQLEFEKDIKSIESSLAQRTNAADVIREAVTDVYGDSIDYIKFIIYLPTVRVLDEKLEEIEQAFLDAFPGMKTRTLKVHSKGSCSKNIHKLSEYRKTTGIIDLVFAVNQLNLGYHPPDLTGVCLMRLTRSAIIGKQQAYRAVFAGAEYPGIIIDFVDCLHKDFVFDTPPPINVQVSPSGRDPLRNMRVANVVVNNRLATIDEMMRNLEVLFQLQLKKKYVKCMI